MCPLSRLAGLDLAFADLTVLSTLQMVAESSDTATVALVNFIAGYF